MQATTPCFQPRTAWAGEEGKILFAAAVKQAGLSHCSSVDDRTAIHERHTAFTEANALDFQQSPQKGQLLLIRSR